MAVVALTTARSEQLIKQAGLIDGSASYAPFDAPALGGAKVIARSWTFNTTDDLDGDTLVEGDTVPLTTLYPGEVLLGVYFASEDMGTDQTVDIGLRAVDGSGVIDGSGTSDLIDYLIDGNTTVAAGGEVGPTAVWADIDDGPLKIEKEVYLTATMDDTSSSDPWAADKDFNGYVLVAASN